MAFALVEAPAERHPSVRSDGAGHGTESVVHLARHVPTGVVAALKCVELSSENDREQLERVSVRRRCLQPASLLCGEGCSR